MPPYSRDAPLGLHVNLRARTAELQYNLRYPLPRSRRQNCCRDIYRVRMSHRLRVWNCSPIPPVENPASTAVPTSLSIGERQCLNTSGRHTSRQREFTSMVIRVKRRHHTVKSAWLPSINDSMVCCATSSNTGEQH